jgi:site-specific recombinase XerD
MNRQSVARQKAIEAAAAACGQSVSAFFDGLVDRALICTCDVKSPATARAYAIDFEMFKGWCAARGLESLPASPQTVRRYLASAKRTLSDATTRRRVAGIRFEHSLAGLPDPTDERIRTAMRNIRRARKPRKTQ